MDYIVDDVVRRVASTGASSVATRRRYEKGGRGPVVPGYMVSYGGVVGGSDAGDTGIPGVIEAVLRIGGFAMGPALVRESGSKPYVLIGGLHPSGDQLL